MEDKRAQYGEDEIITLEFDDGVSFDCGMMGTFELDGKEYIALEALDDSDDVYLYGYQRNDTDFDLLDIPEEEFDRVAAEFDRLMDELSEDEIIRRKETEFTPMTEEEALIQIDLLGHDFFAYTDRDTNLVHILYRREDGGYGLLTQKED